MPKWTYYFTKCHLRSTCSLVIPKRHSTRQRVRFSSHSCLFRSDRTHGCRDIHPGLHPFSTIFAVFDISLWVFNVLKQWRKCRFYGLCNALVLHHNELVLPQCSPLIRHLRGVKIFSPLLAVVRATHRLHWRQCTVADRQTDGKTDRQTDWQTGRRTPRNLVN